MTQTLSARLAGARSERGAWFEMGIGGQIWTIQHTDRTNYPSFQKVYIIWDLDLLFFRIIAKCVYMVKRSGKYKPEQDVPHPVWHISLRLVFFFRL